jgi:hypothetical protein
MRLLCRAREAPGAGRSRGDEKRAEAVGLRPREQERQVYLRYFIAWFPIVVIAFANATGREAVYKRYVGELAAHQISTLTMCILVGIYVWILSKYLKLQSSGQAIGVGLMWLVMTIIFETGLGRYVLGNPWSQVLRDYNISEGRVWPLALLWVTLSPYVFYRIKA